VAKEGIMVDLDKVELFVIGKDLLPLLRFGIS